jgi:hypothetical protein
MCVTCQVPEEMCNKCRLSYIDLGEPVPIEELGPRRFQDESCDHTAYLESCIEGLLKVQIGLRCLVKFSLEEVF